MKKLVLTGVAVAALFAVSSLAQAGRIGGSGVDNKICPARGSVTYYERFYGGELATVSIHGDGDTDLDIYVYDMSGRLVASGTGYSDRETVSWFVSSTQTYRVVVRNLGGVWNRYGLATN